MSHRTWVEVSLPALRSNWGYVRWRVPSTAALCAVVKADAYGHGAVACARAFASAGSSWLAVTSVEEGIRLREAGLTSRILVLGGFAREQVHALVAHHLTPAVWDVAQAQWLAGTDLPVHLKIETGMGRLGATPDQGQTLLLDPHLNVEAVFSHLAASDAADPSACSEQHRRLLVAAGPRPWHLLNSEGALRFPDWSAMLVRVGLALYGYSSQPEHAARLSPALQWKTRVLSVKELPSGHGVGYGPAIRTSRPTRVATLAVGYADGYRRDYAPHAHVMIRGQHAPVLGAISMDLTTVDVTELASVAIGDEVTLLGEPFNAQMLAGWASTIPYEVLCGISARVARIYVD